MNDFDQRESETLKDTGTLVTQFLESGNGVLTEEELTATSPILNSLDESRYHFTDEHFLVAGGEKTIFKVYDSQADRYVAIARPRKHKTNSELEQFLREARLTAKLQHPNILPIYEIGLDGEGIPYFVMRLLTGEGLRQIVRKLKDGEAECRESYPLDRLLAIFQDVCNAVTYAHSRGVLHLDIKPSNVRVGRYGQTILFDWGLAKVVGGEETQLDEEAEEFDSETLNDMTLSGTMKGTPGYMAPEQTVAKGHATAQTDVYALGALLYFILTGRVPVKGDTVAKVIENTRAGRVMNPKLHHPSKKIPGSLAVVAMKALQLAPKDRYATVKELSAEVTRYLRGFAPLAERAGPFKRLQLYGRRHNKVLTSVMLFSALLAVVVGISLVKVNTQRRAAERNLKLYRAETEVSGKLYEDMKAFMLRAASSGDFWDVGLMRNLVDEELTMEISEKYRKELHWMLGVVAFIREEYNAAEDYFEKSGTAFNNVFRKQARLGMELQEDDEHFLTDPQFAQLLEMPVTKAKFRKQVLYNAYNERKNRNIHSDDPRECLRVAIGMLNLINDTPGWGAKIELEPLEDSDYFHLDLSGSPYTMFSPPQYTGEGFVSTLKLLQLKSLDISNSNVRDFSEFRRLRSLEILIARNVKIYNEKDAIFRLANLEIKTLVVSDDMFSDKNLKKLEKSLEVKVLPGR